ncbi:MAG: HAD family hydrolase [Armatimonadota bacterium]
MKYLIWDFDGTLGYREGGMWTGTLLEILAEEAPELGVVAEQIRPFLQTCYPWHTPERPHPDLNTAKLWWEALHPVLSRALSGVGVAEERVPSLVEQFRPRYTDVSRWRLFSDTLPTLLQLSATGWRHILLSNHVPELPGIIEQLGLTHHLAAVFNSAQTGYEKPHPQAFRNVLAFAGKAEAIWMIGDNPNADIAGAEALGVPGILVRVPHPEARYFCEDLAQVVGIAEP